MSAQDVALTKAALLAAPQGTIVDATVTGVRVRVMRSADGWVMGERLDGSPLAGLHDLVDAVLVTDAPILPAPVRTLPLPTEAGEWFWGKTRDSEPQRWFVQANDAGQVWYIPAMDRGAGLASVYVNWAEQVGLVRLPEPAETEAGA